MRIAPDAMGGDQAPEKIVAGAINACNIHDDIDIVLVGKPAAIRKELPSEYKNIEIFEAGEIIEMDDIPTRAIQRKKDSSIVRGMELLKGKKVDAFISAGNTGAVMAAGLFKLGRIKGIKRPSILINFPSIKGRTIVMDNGANTDCKPEHLLQFALMGQIYARAVKGIKEPRVGLLSIGEEKRKGNQLVKDTYQMMEEDPRIENFTGNVEGRDIFTGNCDLVICDGFVGNVILKTTEGVAELMFDLLKKALTKNIRAKLGALLLKPYLKALRDKGDYRQYGGAPLLGVEGVVIISHGNSDEIAIMNAINMARNTIENNITGLIKNEITGEGDNK
ncbi:MAG: phosphate acyltransferase PlsX [Halanaerobiaceae bacterium]